MAEGEGLVGGDFYFADFVVALVVEVVVFGGDGGVIGGEVGVDVDGVWGFIDDVAGGQGDVEGVVPAAGGFEIDGDFAGLVVEGEDVGADDAGADEEQGSGLVGVLAGGELVLDVDGLVEGGGLVKQEAVKDYAGDVMGDFELHAFAAFLFIGVFEEVAHFSAAASGENAFD